MSNNGYSNMYGGQSYGTPQYNSQAAYQPPNNQNAAPNNPASLTWGGTPAKKPWYLQTWFIALLAANWIFIIPLIAAIILLVMQADYDKKLAEQNKTISDAEAYWAYVKEDCAKIYREATEKCDALIEEGKQKKLLAEKQASLHLLKTDKECKAQRAAMEKEMQTLIEQRDFLKEEIRQYQNKSMLRAESDEL